MSGAFDKDWYRENISTGETPPSDKIEAYNKLSPDPLFEKHWIGIVRKIGLRYGDLLDGWWINESWYPRRFDLLDMALKAGSRRRIVAFNPWIRARLIDFQDFVAGEGIDLLAPSNLLQSFLETIDPTTGRLVRGPQADLQAYGYFLLDTQGTQIDWSVRDPNAKITDLLISVEDIRRMATIAMDHHIALSFNIMMYEDDSVSPRTVERLHVLKDFVAERRRPAKTAVLDN